MSSAHQDQDSRSDSRTDANNKHSAADDSRTNRRSRKDGEDRPRTAGSSIGSLISQSLAEESQAGVDRVLADVRDGIDAAREYVSENPREAVALAAAAGIVAWALLGTKPGRKVFEAGAAIAVPYATKWVARNMADALRQSLTSQ